MEVALDFIAERKTFCKHSDYYEYWKLDGDAIFLLVIIG